MQKKVCFEIFTILFSIEIKCDIYKTNIVKSPGPSYFLKSERLPLSDKNYFLLLPNNNTAEMNKTLTIPSTVQSEKQPINKAYRKQYEIINMLWKKTKIFIDVESSTESYRSIKLVDTRIATLNFIQHRNPFQFPTRIQTSTPSYIEFYYVHEVDDCVPNTYQAEVPTVIQSRNISNHYANLHLKPYKLSVTNKSPKRIEPVRVTYIASVKRKLNNRSDINTRDFLDSKNYTNIYDLKLNKDDYTVKSTTVYDKIRFFEIYDNQTQTPIVEKTSENFKNSSKSTSQANDIILEHILVRNDVGHVDNKTRHYVKKHIVDKKNSVNAQRTERTNVNFNSTRTAVLFDLWLENKKYSENMTKAFEVGHKSNTYKTYLNYVNKSTLWTEYPFIAVYIYKPSQVHCDAAGISPHWLIASASCLSRHHGNLGGGGQSAFVTYCGNSWWLPDRVAYVKYSIVHPRYHPHDRIRRQLYNIGVIQIVNSMASACPSWSPVSLMSHQFSANTGDTKATAVGWGLDRYDMRHTPTDLPKRHLGSYESLVYSESCPGSLKYRGRRHLDTVVGTENLYCLSLPPYNGEENDPTHGGLLLVEEKLIALYLQEERRPWGEQSAQYTGTWRLIPWIYDVAQEFDETDTFTIDV